MGKFTEGMTRNNEFDHGDAPPRSPSPPAPKPRGEACARSELSKKDTRTLELEGWSIVAENPLTLCDAHGSVASNVAATIVVAHLKRARREERKKKRGG